MPCSDGSSIEAGRFGGGPLNGKSPSLLHDLNYTEAEREDCQVIRMTYSHRVRCANEVINVTFAEKLFKALNMHEASHRKLAYDPKVNDANKSSI